MVNIFETLKYDENLTIEDYNKITKDIFYKYFKDEKTFLKNKELLRTELVNYVKHISKKEKFEKLFENILKVFNEAINKNPNEVFRELALNLPKVAQVDNLYLSYYINQAKDISNYTTRDLAIYYFDIIDKILESCFKPRLELFFKIFKFNSESIFPDISNKTFGDIVNLISDFDELIKDPYFNIVFSQWRNISTHNDFEITKENIFVKYGQKDNQKTQILSHQELKEITFYINSVYSVLRLAEAIIYLNYTEEIMATDEAKSIKYNIRSEAWLLNIIHNLQTVGFKFYSFNEIENIFELNLYAKQNNDIQKSIIHASQVFTQIAMALDEDEFQKDKFAYIQINILNHNNEVASSAIINVNTCLDYSHKKIDMKQLIKEIDFKISEKKYA